MPPFQLSALMAVAAPLAVAGAGLALAQAPVPPAPPPIAQSAAGSSLTMQGEVVEVFGNKFILQDASGRRLVETGPRGLELAPVKVGDKVTVEARPESGFVHALAVVRPDGRRDELQTAPPPPRGPDLGWNSGQRFDEPALVGSVQRAGYSNVRIADVKKRHAEVLARDAQGQEWELHVEFDGRIRQRERSGPPMDEAQVKTLLERAGYAYAGRMEPRKKHFEVLARNDRGELVELHVDRDGSIRREKRRF